MFLNILHFPSQIPILYVKEGFSFCLNPHKWRTKSACPYEPYKAMLFIMVKGCLCSNIILLFRTFKNFVFHLFFHGLLEA